MGLSVGLDTAVQALRAHQLGVDIASHNIANAQTPGFSRQRALLRALNYSSGSSYASGGLLGRAGNGVDASDINRARDTFLDFQARQAFAGYGHQRALTTALAQTEVVFNDPSDQGISQLLGRFWASWHDVVNDPESAAARTSLVHSTTTLTTRVRQASTDLTNQRTNLNQRVSAIGDSINGAATEIAALNLQIVKVEVAGSAANDLRDRRDFLVDQLSSLAEVSYSEQANGSLDVTLGGHALVSGTTVDAVTAVPDLLNPGMNKLIFSSDSAGVTSTTGELRGVLDARDVDLPALLAKVDTLAAALITSINAVHSAGFGLDNSTGLLFFTGTGASDIALNSVLAAAPQQIAAASALGSPGDGSNALAIVDLQLAATMSAGTQTFDEFYGSIVSILGADAARARDAASAADLMSSHLEGLRQSTSGVNIDEEVTNLGASQHAYNAAARVITAVDEMLDQLINRTGIVGR
ncbi:MAG: flagellar hook-associated protein FlgK [Chloroflexi bacterium]|nr:flagellar hook-associated protein FlgK [Chloroflexota bacterium]